MCGETKKLSVRTKIALGVMIGFFLAEYIATHIPAAQLPKVRCSDKTAHFIAYAVLGAAFTIALLMRGVRLRNVLFAGVIFFPLYGFFDEITQPLVNRYADYYDWRMDMMGAIGTMLLISVCLVIWGKMKKSCSACSKQQTV